MKNKKIIVSPSLLACDFSCSGSEVEKIYKAGAQYIHLDVMDGLFVPNISFGPCVISALRKKNSEIVFDTHLMIFEPKRYIKEFVDCGSDIITVHYEACNNLDETLDLIKSFNIRTGVSVKPDTDVKLLIPFLSKIDMILIMSVEPGFGGQKFIASSLEKIRECKEMIISEGYTNIDIEVDGGVNLNNYDKIIDAGANIIVAGSAIFGSENPQETIQKIKNYKKD